MPSPARRPAAPAFHPLDGHDRLVLDGDGLADFEVGGRPGQAPPELRIAQDGRRGLRLGEPAGRAEERRKQERRVHHPDALGREEFDQAPEHGRRRPVLHPGEEPGQRLVLDVLPEESPGLHLADQHNLRHALGPKKRDKLVELRRADPLEGLSLDLELGQRLAADAGHDTGIAKDLGPGEGLEGESPRPGDDAYSESHASDAFLTIPRLAEPTNRRISSRSSPGGHSASIRATDWAVFRPEKKNSL
jgi:hypothetical protein